MLVLYWILLMLMNEMDTCIAIKNWNNAKNKKTLCSSRGQVLFMIVKPINEYKETINKSNGSNWRCRNSAW